MEAGRDAGGGNPGARMAWNSGGSSLFSPLAWGRLPYSASELRRRNRKKGIHVMQGVGAPVRA